MLQALLASIIAVICGTPTPATTRVVQIDPGPTPTFTASAPALIRACAPARVATLPPITSVVGENFLILSIASNTARWCPCAVSTTTTSTPASIKAFARANPSSPTPTAAPASPTFLTNLTCVTCSSIGRLRWMIPIPPALAIAIAIVDSVTVSIADEITGTASEILRVNQVVVLTSLGTTSEASGSKSTSS